MFKRIVGAFLLGWLLWGGSAMFADFAHGAGIPESCYRYQKELIKQVHNVFGLDAPIATFAAQIQQESGCRPSAVSPVGAQGLTQFMPATARELAERYPTELGPADPLNWKWAIGAQVRYMHDIVKVPWRTPCDWFAAKLSAYNGGEGWLRRDQLKCDARPRCARDVWWNNVETSPDKRRAPQFIGENRGYPRRILYAIEPNYVKADWGKGACYVKPAK